MTTPIRAALAGVHVGDGAPVAVMGALNLSPGSFYEGSVVTRGDDLLRAAERMVREGAALLDVGAMSTAPYLSGSVSASEEARRLGWAVEILASKLGVPVSADTSRAEPARAALEAGAAIINDVRGLTADPALGPLLARAGVGVILTASEAGAGGTGSPVETVLDVLTGSLRIATQAGIPGERIVTDCASRARQLLETNLEKLHVLARALLERETLDGEEINRVLLARPFQEAPTPA